MNPPPVSREQLIANERAAEQAVVQAEVAWLHAMATNDPKAADLEKALADARTASLATRQTMTDGLAAWTQYAAFQEAQRYATAAGIPLPPDPAPAGATQ